MLEKMQVWRNFHSSECHFLLCCCPSIISLFQYPYFLHSFPIFSQHYWAIVERVFFAIKRFLLSPCFSLTKISFNIYLNRAHADDLITESRRCVCLRLDNRHAGGSEQPHKDLDWHDYFLLLCVEYIDFIFVLNKGCLSLCVRPLCALHRALRVQALSCLTTDGVGRGGLKRVRRKRSKVGKKTYQKGSIWP